MWECGLKRLIPRILIRPTVTPYVGVWIETHERNNMLYILVRHSLCGSVD